MSFDFFPNEQGAALLNAARHPSTAPEPGMFDNFASGAGRYTMRSLAEAGRAVSMAGAVVPIVADKLVGDDNMSGKSLTDRYFEAHDEVFNSAVDHWTPKPGEVGTAGQITGQLAGGIMQAIISPALLVGTSQLSSAEDLVRNGVDAKTANTVGVIQGTGAAVGLKMPFLGQTLATRVLSGAGGNLVQGTVAAAASSGVLKAGEYDKQAEQFNPWDLRARTLDVMLGAAFGAMAHVGAANTNRGITPQEDYRRFLAESGLTEKRVQELMAAEQVAPFPSDVTKIKKGASQIAGEGMVAAESIGAGDLIAPGRIDGLRTPAGRYMNHSNNPNAEMRAKSNGDLDVYALQPINAGDEVLVNYRQVGEVNGSGLRNLTPTEEAALLVANQARHIEDATPQGRPATDADATLHADAMRQAIEQVLRGEPVTVDALTKDMQMIPDEAQYRERAEVMDEGLRVAAQETPAGAPIFPKIGHEPAVAGEHPVFGVVKRAVNHLFGDNQAQQENVDPLQHSPESLKARQIAMDRPDLTIPTNRTDADGNPITMRAADALALADAEVAHAQATAAGVFKTAAHCLLGAL